MKIRRSQRWILIFAAIVIFLIGINASSFSSPSQEFYQILGTLIAAGLLFLSFSKTEDKK
jgi:hypothetical protein